jgi:hypothetical protein
MRGRLSRAVHLQAFPTSRSPAPAGRYTRRTRCRRQLSAAHVTRRPLDRPINSSSPRPLATVCHPHRPNGVAKVPVQSATRRERMPRGCRGPATHGRAARSHPARRPPGELLREADLEKIAADSDVPWSLRVQVGSERGQYGWLTHVRALVSPGDAAQVLLEMQRTRPHWRIGRVQVRQTRQGPDPSCGVSRRGCRYVLCLRADHIRRARDRSASGRAVLFSEQFADGYVL